MPIPSSITDLQETEALNSPQGGDQVGGNIDNYFRAHAAIIRRQFSKGMDINSMATLQVPADGSIFNVTKVIAEITNISDNFNGRTVYLKFDAGITLTHSASLILPQAANIVTLDGDVAGFINESTGVWRCISYIRLEFEGIGASVKKAGDTMTGDLKVASGRISSYGYGGDLGVGVLYLNNAETRYLQWDKAKYIFAEGELHVGVGGSYKVWHAGNIDPMPKAGGLFSGAIRVPNNVAYMLTSTVGAFSALYCDGSNVVVLGNVTVPLALLGNNLTFNGSTVYHTGNFNPASKASMGVAVIHAVATVEFASISTGGSTGNQTVDLPNPYVVTGLRNQDGTVALRGKYLIPGG